MRCQSILKALIGSAVIAALAGFGLNSASAQFHYYRVGRTTFGVRPGGFYYHSPRATYAAAPGYVYHSNPHYRVAVGGSTFYYSNPRFTYASVPGSFYYANNAYAMGAIPGGVYYNTPQFTYAGNSSSYYYNASGYGVAASASPDASLATARIILRVPADASVYFDDEPTRQSSSERVFDTPPLSVGKDYTYNVRVEVIRQGTVHRTTRSVDVQAGRTVTVDFPDPSD
jgi:uncharacterized protein (TIGR03000 family)